MAATTRGVFPVGVVLHADPGTQFTSEKLAAYVPAAQGTVSMGRAGVCWDSAMAESIAYPQNRVLLGRVQLSVYPSFCLKGLMHDE